MSSLPQRGSKPSICVVAHVLKAAVPFQPFTQLASCSGHLCIGWDNIGSLQHVQPVTLITLTGVTPHGFRLQFLYPTTRCAYASSELCCQSNLSFLCFLHCSKSYILIYKLHLSISLMTSQTTKKVQLISPENTIPWRDNTWRIQTPPWKLLQAPVLLASITTSSHLFFIRLKVSLECWTSKRNPSHALGNSNCYYYCSPLGARQLY